MRYAIGAAVRVDPKTRLEEGKASPRWLSADLSVNNQVIAP